MTMTAMSVPVFAEDIENFDLSEVIIASSLEEFTTLTGIEIEVLEGEEAEEYLATMPSAYSADALTLTFQSNEPTSTMGMTSKQADGIAEIPANENVYASKKLYFNQCDYIGMVFTPEDGLSGTVEATLEILVASDTGLVGYVWEADIKRTMVVRNTGDVSSYELLTQLQLDNTSDDDRVISVTVNGNK